MTEQIVRTTCNFCQIGCGVLAHVENGRVVRVEGDPANPLSKGLLCTKGLATVEYVYHPDRLQHPLKRAGQRGEGKWQRISWDEALTTIAGKLAEAKEKHGAESVAFSVGAAKTGAAFPRRFATAFGTPNVSWQGHVCFAPRMTASRLTYGFYAVPDYENPPKCLIVWGVNLAANLFHVRIRAGQAVAKGSKLIVIDPRPIDLTARADLWLKVRPGSDLALALAMINIIINEGLYDKEFCEKWTVGFDKLKTHVQQYTPEWAADITWIPAETIRTAAITYATSKPAGIQWGNGIDHGVNSLQTARAIAILKAITGNLNVPGGESEWSVPLGPMLEEQPIPSVKVPEDRWSKRIGTEFPTVPSIKRILPQRLVKAILEEKPYPIRALYIQGANPLLTFADAQETYRALMKVDFLGVADLFMTPTAALADIVLPAASYLEFDAVVSPPYSNAMVVAQQKMVRVGECRSDWEILAGLAEKLGLSELFGGTEEDLANLILKPAKMTFKELRERVGGVAGTMKYKEYEQSDFPTQSGKVEIYSSILEGWGYDPLPTYREQAESPLSEPELVKEFPLVLTSGKSASYRHSGGRQIKSLRADHPEPLVNINPETARKLGIEDGDMVYIETKRGRIKQKAALTEGMDERVVVVDYAWWFPEKGPKGLYGWDEANINILTDGDPPYNRELGSSNLRGIVCKVYKAR